MVTSRRSLLYFALSVVAVTLASLLYARAYPDDLGLLWLALYTIPSHIFVSPFNHEVFLLGVARDYSPVSCALASLAGCLIAGLWDYWLFIPLMHHPRVRPRYANFSIYQKSVLLFRKSPFWALVVVGLTPLPFYPIKFLSIGDRYPLHRYLLALVVGRTPRYWAIAYLGNVLRLPIWSLVAVAVVILVITIVKGRSGGVGKAGAEGARAAGESTSRRVSAKSTQSGK